MSLLNDWYTLHGQSPNKGIHNFTVIKIFLKYVFFLYFNSFEAVMNIIDSN